ncbi:hypothetical protein L226DRAFT_574356 [Lentinus tigrinus ALCF2SS1-7]|uniref:Peptidase S33 tripeptidyl aminopeptidase-like C-terminal domain-containing protein n=1 Tax=Lentinus tigrinus ALCF2SS1-6 TaxID=1328759 RepID=A0A5C2S9G1_9APHY|nr:hypothetical protein L227DRAFT_100327 [Lentinus tigrinus ALCF2SS1-6]RPD70904.1 hypothetical protein L226DRAFT_574356 [Lentinus tigrinus ALCF2SS1-7]
MPSLPKCQLLGFLVGVLLAGGAIAADTASDDAGQTFRAYDARPCREGSIIECGEVRVPLDWHHPSTGDGSVVFARYPATNPDTRKGTVFLHSGVWSFFSSVRAPQIDLNRQAHALHQRLNGEYDLVMWTPRGRGTPGISVPGTLSCFEDSIDMSTFYWDMGIRELDNPEAPLSWDEDTLEWTHKQTADEALMFHRVQERTVISCLENAEYQEQADMLKYMGTAATVRDMVAMADAFDGPDAPIHFWGIQPGSLIGSYLQKMFPERAGRLVMDDPVDPITYNEVQGYLRWQSDIATANTSVAILEESCTSDKLADCAYPSGPPRPDMAFVAMSINLLRRDLMGWINQPVVELQNSRNRQFYDSIQKEPSVTQNWKTFEEYAKVIAGHSFWGARPVMDPDALGLRDMPIICGDALYEHDPDNKTLRADAEAVLKGSLHSVPLLMSSAFPSWRFLCHLWPIRAVERVSFSAPQDQTPVQETLVLLRKPDPWNYPRVSDADARRLWPDAHVFADLEFGQYMFDHNNCNLDLIASFLANGTVPEDGSPCANGDERRHQASHALHRKAHKSPRVL